MNTSEPERSESVLQELKNASVTFFYRLNSRPAIPCAFLFSVFGAWFTFLPGSVYFLNRDAAMGLGVELLGGVLLVVCLSWIGWRDKSKNGINYRELEATLVGVKRRFYILTTYTYLFNSLEEIEPPVNRTHVKDCRRQLDKLASLKPEVEIRILVMDPDSEGAKERQKHRPDSNVIENIRENCHELHKWKLNFNGRWNKVAVRVYRDLPRLSLKIWDDTCSVAFFERGKPQSSCKRTEVFASSPIGKLVEASFNDLWEDEQTMTIEQYVVQKSSCLD